MCHYNQNFSFFKDRPPFPCMPIIISSGGKLNMESAGSTNLVGPWWYLRNHFPPFEGLFDTSRFRCQVVEKQRRKALDFATASPRTQRSDGNHGSAKHAHEAKRHAKTSVCGVCQICVSRQAPSAAHLPHRHMLHPAAEESGIVVFGLSRIKAGRIRPRSSTYLHTLSHWPPPA